MPFGLGEAVLPAVGAISPISLSAETTSETGREGSVAPRSGESESTSAAKTRTANTRTDVKTQRKSSAPARATGVSASRDQRHRASEARCRKICQAHLTCSRTTSSPQSLWTIMLEDNVVMVTWANNHYYDFVSNWVRNVRKCGVSNFMVGAMDNELLAQLSTSRFRRSRCRAA